MRDLDRRLGGSPEHNTSLEVAFDELPPRRIVTAYLKTTTEGTVIIGRITGNPEVNCCYQVVRTH